jgi:hypothetical protein
MRNSETKISLVALSLCASLCFGCNGAAGNELVERSGAAASPEAPASLAVTPSEPSAAVPVDWEAWVASEVKRLHTDDPELYNAVRTLEPRITRARTLRFSGADLLTRPDAAPLLIDRLIHGQDDDDVRAALVEAIGGTGAPFGPAIVELLERERDTGVRRVMVSVLRYADSASAQRGLALGLSDSEASVRIDAVYALARRNDAAMLSDALLVAATDPDDGVRQAAAQTLGAMGVDEAKDTLVGLLSDANPEVRYISLRALERIDAGYVATLPKAKSLRDDADPRVAKLATRLTTP